MLFYLLLLPVLLAPAVWVYLGRYAGSNDHAELLIHPPTRPPQPSGLRPVTKRKHAVRGLSFMASDRPMVNPFVNATPNLTPYERAKLSVLSVTLLPVRMVLAVLVLTVAVLWLSVCTLGVSPKALRTRPLPAWRRAMRFPTKVFTRLFLMCFGFYYIKETGKRCSPDEAAVIVPNHVSFIEPVYLAGCHMLSAVSRAANARAPIIGRGILALQCILVDRLDPQSRTKTKEAIAQRAVPGSGWGQFMIFPEGTTCNTMAVISFRYGAFTPGQPVQPVAIRYPAKHFDPCWVVQGPGALGLSLRMLCQFVNHMEVTWLPVVKPSEAERNDPQLYSRNVQKVIAAALKVPTTDHSFSDVVLAMDAKKHGVSPTAGAMVELTKLRNFLDVNVQTAQHYLDTFMALDTSGTGQMDLPTFAKVFGHGVTTEITRLFEMLDADESGALDFREYLTGLAIINEQGKDGRTAALRLAFGMFDETGDNTLSKEQLERVLRRALPDLSNEGFEALWKEADTSGDGKVDIDEFLAFAERHKEMLPVFRREYL